MCYDEQVDVHGNYDSASVTHLHFYFDRCNQTQRPTCKNDTEFREFTKNLYYIHVYNSVRFSQTGYKEKALSKESRLKWTRLPIDNIGDEVVYIIQNKEIRR